jgi:hypothetical protein
MEQPDRVPSALACHRRPGADRSSTARPRCAQPDPFSGLIQRRPAKRLKSLSLLCTIA